MIDQSPRATAAATLTEQLASSAPRVLSVLVVEDTRATQRFVTSLLELRGHRCIVANNGIEALAILAKQEIDVALMDVQMPEMDGLQTTTRIRQREQGAARHLPIVALTSHSFPSDVEQCRAAGMDAHIAKPIDIVQFISLVESLAGSEPRREVDARDCSTDQESHS